MADLKRDKAGQSGTLSRGVPGQNGTSPFRGVPVRPVASRPEGEGKGKAAGPRKTKLSRAARLSMLVLGMKP
jgi:hypothetical protein